ncbi:MAG: low temperature requirement protein A [Actinobacteria bacterium]|nr:low temperature requirement protein A [Actinomycetota bacterium]
MASTVRERLTGRAVVRDRDEEHRAATPLELFFDLTYVVAVGRAAGALHHQLAEGEVARGLLGFATVFFAVWWGWMNFTWFASAHDSDDVPHRLLTFVQITGALVLAAGITRAAEDRDFAIVVLGYVVMRLGLVGSWLRVARDQPTQRRRAGRYAAGLFGLQLLWIAWLAVPSGAQLAVFVVLGAAELAVPMWAEAAASEPVFHPDHIEERYGLFTIILLGESIVSATAGFQVAFDDGGLTGPLAAVGLGGLVVAFSAWWLYFDHPGHLAPQPAVAFRWGYAHVVLFASLAALGAGLHLASEAATGHADERTAALAVAVPAAGYLLGLVLVLVVSGATALAVRVWPKAVGAVAILVLGAVASVPVTAAGAALVLAGLATAMVLDGPSHEASNLGRGETGR